MKINLIKTLKNQIVETEVKAGLSARENFPEIDFENAAVIINGKLATPDVIFTAGDVVTIRLLPGDLSETNWFVANFLIPFGFIIKPAELAYQAKKEAEKAAKELEKLKKLTNQNDIDNRPFLRGASNTLATGKSQPYMCGRNFLTPYLFSKPYYKIAGADGAEQYVYNILEGGFKDIVLNKLGIGDVTIKTFSDTEPQNGVYSIDSSLFADGVIEIKQDGILFESLPELNYKVVSNAINSAVVKDIKVQEKEGEYLVFTLNPYAKDVDVCITFPYGLYAYNDDGDRIETQVTITPEYSLDGGNTFTEFSFSGGNTFQRNVLKEIRFVAHHNFTLSDYTTLLANDQSSIIIRVRSNGNEDQKIKNDCYVYYYQSAIFDPLKSSSPAGVLDDSGAAGLVSCLNVEDRERAYSCVIGLKLKATEANEDKLTQINIIATNTARTWDGEAWSETKSPTRNPAAIALEILTSDTHPASRYSDSEIDLDSFGALYEYCETNNIYFDYTITQSQKKDATLALIANVCNVAFYIDIYGRRSVAIDQVQQAPIAIYNPQNIISLTNKKTFSRRVDALRIKYIDSANDTYKETTYTVTRLENGEPVTINEDSIIKEVDATGITTYDQVVKYGRRLMAADELRQITTSIQIGGEGVYYTPFAKIGIQDPSLTVKTEDTIIDSVGYESGYLTKINLKNPVTFEPGKNYGVIINMITDTRAYPLALRVTGSGTTTELTVTDTYLQIEDVQPAENNIVAFGELDEDNAFTQIMHEYIITRIARATNGFTLDLQEYNAAMYDSGTIPAYKPLASNTPTLSKQKIPIDAVTTQQLEERMDSANGDSAQAAIDTINNGFRFSSVYQLRNPDLTLEEVIARMDEDRLKSHAGISISEEEILLQVENTELALRGLISVQAGAVTALVEGGGASGHLALSIELPAMIDATTRAAFIAASTEEKVNNVYALVANTEYYGIKPAATASQIKALWDDAISAGLLASQLDLSATQIKLSADNVYIDGDVIVNDDNKIKAALIDVENLLASDIAVKEGGVIHSENYNGTIDEETGEISGGDTGWAIDNAGNAVLNNLVANNAQLTEATVQGTVYANTGHFSAGIGEYEDLPNTILFDATGKLELLLICSAVRVSSPIIPWLSSTTIKTIYGAYIISGYTQFDRYLKGTGQGVLIKLYENTAKVKLTLNHITSEVISGSGNYHDYYSITVDNVSGEEDVMLVKQKFQNPYTKS